MMATVVVFGFTACGGDDDNSNNSVKPTPTVDNANANTAANAKRLEFPRLQDATGSNLYVIKDENTQEINYSVEWNKSKRLELLGDV